MSKSWQRRLGVAVASILVLAAGACTGNGIDDADSADVFLEVEALENPAITASLDSQTGLCTFVITEWSFRAANIPKSELAGLSPLNDISLIRVTIDYAWIDPTLSTPQRVVGLGGVVVPVNDTNTMMFSPIAFDDLSIAFQGATANLTMRFEGETIEGSPVSGTVFRQLNIETCS